MEPAEPCAISGASTARASTVAHPEEQDMRTQLDRLWEVYAAFADATFRQGFARDSHAHFWEMYLGCRLL